MKIIKVARNKLYLESDEILDVNPDIIYEMGLSRKEELSHEEYKRVTYLASMAKSLFLLSRRDYSEKEMLMKLKQKYNEHNEVERVVEKLVSIGYIDDYAFARSFVERTHDSKRKIEYQLGLKGISREIVSEVFSEGEHDEKAEIRKQLKKVLKREKEKQIAYLMRKGFKYGDIKEVMEEF